MADPRASRRAGEHRDARGRSCCSQPRGALPGRHTIWSSKAPKSCTCSSNSSPRRARRSRGTGTALTTSRRKQEPCANRPTPPDRPGAGAAAGELVRPPCIEKELRPSASPCEKDRQPRKRRRPRPLVSQMAQELVTVGRADAPDDHEALVMRPTVERLAPDAARREANPCSPTCPWRHSTNVLHESLTRLEHPAVPVARQIHARARASRARRVRSF
jgi:hypothetical protein